MLAQVVGNGMDGQILQHNTDYPVRMPKDNMMQFRFPELLVGGGFLWLEVFTKNDPALGITPSGLYVTATGTPQVVRIAWTDLDCKPIIGKVTFGSTVLLNIYTAHMYGQDVEVGLWDKDTIDWNDLLPINNKDSFSNEVLLYKLLPNEIDKTGVSGGIKINGKSESQVQKIRIPVLIDLKWMFSAGKELKIYPTVKSKETGKFIKIPKDCFLEVGLDGLLHETVIEPTNNPALVGKVKTNIAHFSPCQYTGIELINDKGEITELYKESNTQKTSSAIETNIIAGSKKKKYTIQVDQNSNVAECNLSEKSKHTNQLTVVGEKLPSNITILNQTPTKIDFEAWFDYTKINLFDYFFLTESKLKARPNLLVKADTCRHHHDVYVKPVPDIEWKISLLFSDKTMPQSLATSGMPNDLSRTSGSDTSIHPKDKRKSIYEEQLKKANEAAAKRKKGSTSYDFDLTVIRTMNKIPEEWGQNVAEKIQKFVDVFKFFKESVDTLCNNDKKHAQKIIKKLPKPKMMPVFIKIDYPAIRIDGSWKYAVQPHKNNIVEPSGEISFAFEPLLKGTGGIDLIALSFALGKTVPVVNLVLEAIEVLEVGGDLLAGVFGYEISKKLELNIYIFGQVNVSVKIPINSVDIIKGKVEGRVGLGVQLKAEVGVVKKGLVLEGDDDSSGDQGFGYALDAKAEGFFEAAVVAGFDKTKGFFLEPTVGHGGIKITIIGKKIGQVKNKDSTFQLPAIYIIPPNKEWFKGRYHPLS